MKTNYFRKLILMLNSAIILSLFPLSTSLAQTYGTNLVLNPGFESGLTTSWSNSSAALESTYPVTELKSARLTGGTGFANVNQVIGVVENTTYRFSFKGRILDVAGPSGGASTSRTLNGTVNASSSVGDLLKTITITQGTDIEVSGEFTVPDGVTQVYIKIAKPNGFGYVDDVKLQAKEWDITTNTNASSITCTDCAVKVATGAELTVSADKTLPSVTVAAGGKLTLTAGTLTATNGITLESDATGTATMMDNYENSTVNATIKQYVTAGRNWYMSAPLNNTATVSMLNRGASVQLYNEETGLWEVASGTLTRGKGYVQVANSTQGTTGTVNFAGVLNSGNVPISLTNNSGGGKGFNLVGNPYPSYLSWSALASDNTANGNPANMPNGTMWYRTVNYNGKSAWQPTTTYNQNDIVYNGTRFFKATSVTGTSAASGGPAVIGNITTGITDGTVTWNYEGSVYQFATVSASGDVLPSTVSNLVPPMQAFWVKSNGGTLTFKNAYRSHNTGGSNLLKAPKSSNPDKQLIRLKISNSVSADEIMLYTSANATNNLDTYDAPKFFNTTGSNQPELYTQVGSEKLAVNAMNQFPLNTEIALGFLTEKASSFSLKASEISNFDANTRIILKDNIMNNETDITDGSAYEFTSSVVNNSNRFALVFRAPGVTTGVDNPEQVGFLIYINDQNEIVINTKTGNNYAIYNAVGQIIERGITSSNVQTSNFKQTNGVYFVKVGNKTQKVIVK